MIRKSVKRRSEKIMLEQEDSAHNLNWPLYAGAALRTIAA